MRDEGEWRMKEGGDYMFIGYRLYRFTHDIQIMYLGLKPTFRSYATYAVRRRYFEDPYSMSIHMYEHALGTQITTIIVPNMALHDYTHTILKYTPCRAVNSTFWHEESDYAMTTITH